MTLTIEQILHSLRIEAELEASFSTRVSNHELVIFHDAVPENELSVIESRFKNISPQIRTIDIHGGGFIRIAGGLGGDWHKFPEWIITAGILIIIGKGLLDGFLKEFGATGARTVKETIKKLFRRQKEQHQRYISLFPGGIPTASANKKTSISIAIKAGKTTIQFAFPYQLSESSLNGALDALPEVIPVAKALAETSESRRLIRFTYENEDWREITPKKSVKALTPSRKKTSKKTGKKKGRKSV